MTRKKRIGQKRNRTHKSKWLWNFFPIIGQDWISKPAVLIRNCRDLDVPLEDAKNMCYQLLSVDKVLNMKKLFFFTCSED